MGIFTSFLRGLFLGEPEVREEAALAGVEPEPENPGGNSQEPGFSTSEPLINPFSGDASGVIIGDNTGDWGSGTAFYVVGGRQLDGPEP